MNDVIENIKHSKIWLFADDTILYKEITTVRDAKQLQEDLKSLHGKVRGYLNSLYPNVMFCIVTPRYLQLSTTVM